MAIADIIALVEKYLNENKNIEAEKELDKLLVDNDSPSFKITLLKSQILLRKKELENCRLQANKALEKAFNNGKRAQIADALKIISMAYFNEKNYNESFKYIVHANSFDDSVENSEIKMFKNVVTMKYMKKNAITDQSKLKYIEAEILSISLKPVSPKKEDSKPVTGVSQPTKQNMRFDWFDSGKSVEVSIYVKKINAESVDADIHSNSVSLTFEDSNNFKYDFRIDELFDSINVDESTYKVYGTKLTILLTKENSTAWTDIKKTDQITNTTIPEINRSDKREDTPVSYPTSSIKKTDWAKFKIDDDEEDEENEDPDRFFKKLYSGADDNARKAMMKSFIESNGTSLSTDWSDVGSRKVKPYGKDDK